MSSRAYTKLDSSSTVVGTLFVPVYGPYTHPYTISATEVDFHAPHHIRALQCSTEEDTHERPDL
jgi:hypothetical protein